MKFAICAVILAVGPASASSGALESTAASADFINNSAFRAALPDLPAFAHMLPISVAIPSSPEWIKAVKKAYLSCPQGGLPPVSVSELPAAALQQMYEDASIYPSKAYKIVIGGHAAFVIENDNLDALFVNIFDENGAHIAYGGFDENYDFYWLVKKVTG